MLLLTELSPSDLAQKKPPPREGGGGAAKGVLATTAQKGPLGPIVQLYVASCLAINTQHDVQVEEKLPELPLRYLRKAGGRRGMSVVPSGRYPQ